MDIHEFLSHFAAVIVHPTTVTPISHELPNLPPNIIQGHGRVADPSELPDHYTLSD